MFLLFFHTFYLSFHVAVKERFLYETFKQSRVQFGLVIHVFLSADFLVLCIHHDINVCVIILIALFE